MRLITFLCMCILSFQYVTASSHPPKEVKIALISDGYSQQVKRFRIQFFKEINDLLQEEFIVTYADEAEYTGSWTRESINHLIDEAFDDPTIDIVVTTGVIGSDLLSQRTTFPKPTFAPFVIDEIVQQFPNKEGVSNIHNFNYLRPSPNTNYNISIFKEMAPFKNLAILLDEALITTIPNLNPALKYLEEENDIRISLLPVDGDIDGLDYSLANDGYDAVYIGSISSLDIHEVDALIELLIKLKLPSFSHYGLWLVEKGILATNATDIERVRIARRIALNIQQTILGEDPKNFSIYIKDSSFLSINMNTARAIGVSIPFSLVLESQLIDPINDDPSLQLSLPQAVCETLNNNLELAISERDVYAGREDVNLARSRLKPQVEISAFGRIIDRDRAIGANGREPQSALYGEANGSQVLYSNELFGDVRVQTHVQCARVEEYFRTRLDTVFNVSVAYLNYLRNRTLQKIQRNNLKLTRTNLALARQRVDVGVARYSEIYRWESEISTNQTSVVNAFYESDSARIRLNKILNRDQTTVTLPIEVTLQDPYWLMSNDWFDSRIRNFRELEIYKNFSVLEGMLLSPELKELGQQVRAQAERLGITNRAMWQPSLSLIGEFSDRLAEGGAGTKPLSPLSPSVDTVDWLVGFNLSFPLYEGGGKTSRQRRAFQTLMGLKLQLKNLAQIIEESIRVNINKASASFAAIGLAKNSAIAANKNLQLVTEQYSRGTTNIVDLLDAQNQALVADLTSANAEYDFLIDLIAVQRAIGRFDFLMTDAERMQWLKYLDIYFKKHEVKRS